MSEAADDSSIRENRSASTNRTARPAQGPYYRPVIARQWVCHTFPMTRFYLHDLLPPRAVLKRKMWHRRLMRIPLIFNFTFHLASEGAGKATSPILRLGSLPF